MTWEWVALILGILAVIGIILVQMMRVAVESQRGRNG